MTRYHDHIVVVKLEEDGSTDKYNFDKQKYLNPMHRGAKFFFFKFFFKFFFFFSRGYKKEYQLNICETKTIRKHD